MDRLKQPAVLGPENLVTTFIIAVGKVLFVSAVKLSIGSSGSSGLSLGVRCVTDWFLLPQLSSSSGPQKHLFVLPICTCLQCQSPRYRITNPKGAALAWFGVQVTIRLLSQNVTPECVMCPRQAFFELAQKWRHRYQATLVSLQLEGHDQQPVRGLIEEGELEQPLRSPDWLQTAEELASLDLLVSVDTSVAHLAGALGIPTLLMLNAPADWRWGRSWSWNLSLRSNDPGSLF